MSITYSYIYYGGGALTPYTERDATLATFDTTGQKAAIAGRCGNGKFFLYSMHCEVLSDSGLNSTDTTRAFLKACIQWVLGEYRKNLPVLIYNESGEVWAPSVSGFEAALTDLGISYTEQTAAQINASGGLIGTYRAIYLPGGLGVGTTLNSNGRTYIDALIRAGGGLLAICSGTYGSATDYVWEGTPGAGMGWFCGNVNGAIDAIAPWPGEVLTSVTTDLSPLYESSHVLELPYSPTADSRKRFLDVKGWFSPLMVSQGWFWTWWPAAAEGTIKTITDSAAASDALGIGVVLAIAESGQGSDTFGMGAALSLEDAGSGADIIAQLLAQLAVNDTGAGADALDGVSALVPVADAGAGSDAPPSISVTFVITDAGAGSESISILQTILVAIADAAAANDSLSVSANVSTVDIGQGTDAIALSVNLSVADTGSGTDSVSVLMDILKTVADIAQASDDVGPITVNLAVSDSGTGLDLLSALNVVAQIVDYATGLDVVIRIVGEEAKIISITFVGKRPTIRFSSKMPEIMFAGKEASMSFVSNQPEIVFSGGRTAQIEFSSQGGQ